MNTVKGSHRPAGLVAVLVLAVISLGLQSALPVSGRSADPSGTPILSLPPGPASFLRLEESATVYRLV
jgi:hypothetical protein